MKIFLTLKTTWSHRFELASGVPSNKNIASWPLPIEISTEPEYASFVELTGRPSAASSGSQRRPCHSRSRREGRYHRKDSLAIAIRWPLYEVYLYRRTNKVRHWTYENYMFNVMMKFGRERYTISIMILLMIKETTHIKKNMWVNRPITEVVTMQIRCLPENTSSL